MMIRNFWVIHCAKYLSFSFSMFTSTRIGGHVHTVDYRQQTNEGLSEGSKRVLSSPPCQKHAEVQRAD